MVLGLGAAGSATAHALARRGLRVIGIDRHRPPHPFGSSHGSSRIIREAYFEDPRYVPLVQEAWARWRELEAASETKLLQRTGGLMIGPPDGELVAGARRSARTHGLSCEELDARELERRFPVFAPKEGTVAIFEQRAGILFPERCLETFLRLARSAGADLRFGTAVERWEADGEGTRVRTAHGEWLRSRHLVLCAGPWLAGLVPELDLPLEVERQVVHYFAPHPEAAPGFDPSCLPIFIWEHEPDRYWYGLPDTGEGLKLALHHQGENVDPDRVRRQVTLEEIAALRSIVEPVFRHPFAGHRRSEVCLYTNTPDRHFLVDRHPEHPQVVLCSPCSGHGFKFSILLGEILADLVEGTAEHDLELFSLGRLGA